MINIRDMIKRHEGYRKHAYLDSRKIWTTGVGFNLERAGAKEALKKHGINPDMIWAAIEEAKKAGGGRKPGEHTVDVLTDDQVNVLLDDDIAESVKDLHVMFPDFDNMPEAARAVLIDLHFNMGGATLRTFKNTIKCLKAGNWDQAAENLTKSLWYTQVGIRAKEIVKMLQDIK